MSPALAFAAPASAIPTQLPKPATGFLATVSSAFAIRSPSPLATAEPIADFIQPCIGQFGCPLSPHANFFAAAVAVPVGAALAVPVGAALAVPVGSALGLPDAAGASLAVAEAVAVAVTEAVTVAVVAPVCAAAVVPAGAPDVPEPSPPHAAESTSTAPRAKDQANVRFILRISFERFGRYRKGSKQRRVRRAAPSTMAKRKPLPSVVPPRPAGSPIRPAEPPPDGRPPLTFHRGNKYPTAIAWFGFKSFWGHLWSILASVIATEDIDSRDWMRPERAEDFLRTITGHLSGRPDARSLTEALDRDVWIDFVADTGDDVSVSRAVADMLFDTYEVDDPDEIGSELHLPRGDVLLFGGDTAYPVANELEIHNRVIVPFNKVLQERVDGRPRVLLGVPGNHDWFAGLDGFGRMFRAPLGTIDRSSVVMGGAPDGGPEIGEIDKLGQLRHFFEWAEAMRIGKRVEKRGALPLFGYMPVQSASYWALPLAPSLDIWGPDRQLTTIDTRQRLFFASRQDDAPNGLLLCMADPPFAFLEPHPAGQDILRSLDLSFKEEGVFALTGDIHHYCRIEPKGGGLHVTAGGGGAFLHPARIARAGLHAPAAEFPGPKTSRILTAQIPVQLALGRAGFILHVALALAYMPMQQRAWSLGHPSMLATVLTGAGLAVVLALLGGHRGPRAWKVVLLATASAALLAAVPFGMNAAAITLGADLRYVTAGFMTLAYAAMVFAGIFVIGVYLMLLTYLGLATDQGFGPLAHPGYKHFVRLRVRKDGSRVDGWVLGKVDPLRRGEPVVLVDRFRWLNPKASAPR